LRTQTKAMFGSLRDFAPGLMATGLGVAVLTLSIVALQPALAFATTASLGDSYSSGEGAGPFSRETDLKIGNGCHRSAKAWPRLLGVPAANHFACSGATTGDFFTPQKSGLLAGQDGTSQLDRLRALATREPISKVYVTIGGNDLGFAGIIRDCRIKDCLKQMDKKELPKLEDVVKPAVENALAETGVAAAGGQVILVGYPDVIPSRGSRFHDCGWITDQEKPRIWELEDALDTALSQAAAAAGVSYVSIRSALKGHELCTDNSWVFPVTSLKGSVSSKLVNPQQGHPNAEGQQAIADAVRSAERTGAGVVPPPPAGCTPANSVAAIVDDSGSMEVNDPLDIRGAAMQLLITKPGEQARTLGAVEFGAEAGPLFAPATVAAAQPAMLSSLSELRNDGYGGDGGSTDYNAAFAESSGEQPAANARIFLTDGGHNVGPYLNGHLGGPRTYVVGLNIGPAGDGNPEADLLGRIAAETGGHYFPLQLAPSDSPDIQSRRLQPVFNAIDSLLQCTGAPQQAVRTLAKANAVSRPLQSAFAGAVGLEVVLSWTTPGTQVGLAGAVVRNGAGAVIANLTGKPAHHRSGRRKRRSRKPAQLQPGVVQGSTFETITIPRPAHGSTLSVAVSAPVLTAPTTVNIQVSPLQTLPSAGASPAPVPASNAPGAPQPAPGQPPANHAEQETPNHPVNTFTNYHNASGMGPAIASGQWVEISCRVYDPTIASVNPDGYWYRIASPPWNNAYYSPANTFMNGDPYGGPYTHNTDFSVPVC
jgi:hypothetical protein